MLSGQSGSSAQALLSLRIIAASLGAGVTLFAGVSWFVHQEGGPFMSGGDRELVFQLFLVLAALAVIAAAALWRLRVVPLLRRPATGDWAERATTIQTPLILTWAIIEAASLGGVGVYFLYGILEAGLIGVALMWLGLAATWPRHEWFDADR